MNDKKTSSDFLKEQIEVRKSESGLKDSDIYGRMGISKPNFYRNLNPGRDTNIGNLKRWRIGLGMSRTRFWKAVADFFDGEK
jgi:predicted DNA-binding transcriptional regulator AlpA